MLSRIILKWNQNTTLIIIGDVRDALKQSLHGAVWYDLYCQWTLRMNFLASNIQTLNKQKWKQTKVSEKLMHNRVILSKPMRSSLNNLCWDDIIIYELSDETYQMNLHANLKWSKAYQKLCWRTWSIPRDFPKRFKGIVHVYLCYLSNVSVGFYTVPRVHCNYISRVITKHIPSLISQTEKFPAQPFCTEKTASQHTHRTWCQFHSLGTNLSLKSSSLTIVQSWTSILLMGRYLLKIKDLLQYKQS